MQTLLRSLWAGLEITYISLNKDKCARREESVVQSVIPKAAARHTQALKERRRGSEGKGRGEEKSKEASGSGKKNPNVYKNGKAES